MGETQLGFLLQIKGISFYLLAKFQQTAKVT